MPLKNQGNQELDRSLSELCGELKLDIEALPFDSYPSVFISDLSMAVHVNSLPDKASPIEETYFVGTTTMASLAAHDNEVLFYLVFFAFATSLKNKWCVAPRLCARLVVVAVLFVGSLLRRSAVALVARPPPPGFFVAISPLLPSCTHTHTH